MIIIINYPYPQVVRNLLVYAEYLLPSVYPVVKRDVNYGINFKSILLVYYVFHTVHRLARSRFFLKWIILDVCLLLLLPSRSIVKNVICPSCLTVRFASEISIFHSSFVSCIYSASLNGAVINLVLMLSVAVLYC